LQKKKDAMTRQTQFKKSQDPFCFCFEQLPNFAQVFQQQSVENSVITT